MDSAYILKGLSIAAALALIIYANDGPSESPGRLGKRQYRPLGPVPDSLIKQVCSGSGGKSLSKQTSVVWEPGTMSRSGTKSFFTMFL